MKRDMNEAAQWRDLLHKKDREIEALHRQIDWLTQQLRRLNGRVYGCSSERSAELQEQLCLFEASSHETVRETPSEASVLCRRKKRCGKREADFSGLPVEQILHELPQEQRRCPQCGGELHACGHSVLRRELTYIPAQYKLTEHIQTAYSYRQCERAETSVPMKKSTVPPALLPGSGIVSASLLAQIMNSKYVLALPLYRQEQELHRLGLPVSRQTMSNWVLIAGERWLLPVYHALHKELLANEILHADETTLMVLREPERQARQRSYVWLYRTSGNALRPVVLYDYQPSRAGVCASRFLEGFSGYLHTDGYEAYHCSLPETVCSVGCWAHMRRKFTDTLKSLPKELRSCSPAQTGLDFCNRLFALETEFSQQARSLEQRYVQRKQRSEPVAEEFFRWAEHEYEKNPVPKSLYGAALGYALKQRGWLMHVFCDGRPELSNNRAERSVRPFAIGRKNWLFSNTPLGAKISAVIYSLVETAKTNGLNPAKYLEYLLTALPCGNLSGDCLPWLPAVQTICKA